MRTRVEPRDVPREAAARRLGLNRDEFDARVDNLIARGFPRSRPDGLLLHFCAKCGAWGAFGYAVNLRAGRPGRWYCAEHRPQGTAQ